MAKVKQIFLSSCQQRRSTWTYSEVEEEEVIQISPMVQSKVSTQNVTSNATQTQVHERMSQIITSSSKQHFAVQMPPNTYFYRIWPVHSQAQLEQERAQERRNVSIIDLQQRIMTAEQDNQDLNQKENPISHQNQLKKRRENKNKQSDPFWKARDPDQQALDKEILLTNTISDYAARTEDKNVTQYHGNTIEKQIIQIKKRYPLQKPRTNIQGIIWTRKMKQELWKNRESRKTKDLKENNMGDMIWGINKS
ncbi:MAG: hypothetical protein EZS28_008707, partial [Streblomastix strix]